MAALTAVTAGDISDSCNLIMNSGDLKLSPDSGLSQEEPVVERTKTETILEPGGDYLLGNPWRHCSPALYESDERGL